LINSGEKGKANNYWFPKEPWFEETEKSRAANRRSFKKIK